MRPPLFFIHVPKSGGCSIIDFLELNCGSGQYVRFMWSPDHLVHERPRLINTGIGGGHYAYGIHRELKMPVRYCTVLRDPLARQVSHYWFARNGKNGDVERGASVTGAEELIRLGKISLDEWVEESCDGGNLYVRMLSGQGRADSAALEMARLNIEERFTEVGLCEDMSVFLLALCGRTKLQYPFYVEANRTIHPSQVRTGPSAAARQKFVADNALDYALYDHVKRKNDQQIRAAGPRFARALEVVRSVQSVIGKLDNPLLNSTFIDGVDPAFVEKVRTVVRGFDLSAIADYIAFERERVRPCADLYDGYVDSVQNGSVAGWAINLNHPDQSVQIDIIARGRIVASGVNNGLRADVAEAGYPTAKVGFSIPLPDEAAKEFSVAISGSSEVLNGGRVWRHGWHASDA